MTDSWLSMTEITAATERNSSFSKELPSLQLALDSTSLGAFKTCPQRYLLEIVLGYQLRDSNVHLQFGIWVHASAERYARQRADGATHEDALRDTLHWLLRETWDRELQRPWNSGHNEKTRFTLVRSVVWYLDQYGENDPLQTVVQSNGRPAVELSFRFDSGYRALSTGEMFVICGHMDRKARFNGEPMIADIKTTRTALGQQFFSQFTPHNQFSIYLLADQVVSEDPARGLVVDGMQVLVGGTRFQRGVVTRTQEQLAEFHQDLGLWIEQLEEAAQRARRAGASAWAMNDKSCSMYGGCPFQAVCSRSPSARASFLRANYRQRIWDPLIVRGDI